MLCIVMNDQYISNHIVMDEAVNNGNESITSDSIDQLYCNW